MLTEFLDRILEIQQPPTIEVDGITYTRDGNPWYPPQVALLHVTTLTGLVDYLKSPLDEHIRHGAKLALHIESPTTVSLVGCLDPRYLRRRTMVVARIERDFTMMGQVMRQEQFSVFLQTAFVQTKERDALLTLISSIRSDDVRSLVDNGMTQTVAARKGVVLTEATTVPNPVKLRPFRTFCEVEQPESLFCLRVTGEKEQIAILLYEVASGTWKADAMNAIKKWLKEKTVDVPNLTILA